MDRRSFLRGAAIIAAGAIAVDQLELIEKLTHERKLFPAYPGMPSLWMDGIHDDAAAISALYADKPAWNEKEKRVIARIAQFQGTAHFVRRRLPDGTCAYMTQVWSGR